MEVKFTKEQTDFLNKISTIVHMTSGSTYRHIPFWFKETEEEGVYELLTFEHLPDELTEALKNMRE
jgi:hypothetical protein